MTQTRRQSLIEAGSNTALCTFWSIMRGYYVRRWWNNKLTKGAGAHEEH